MLNYLLYLASILIFLLTLYTSGYIGQIITVTLIIIYLLYELGIWFIELTNEDD